MAIGVVDGSKGIQLTLPANKLCCWTMGTQTAGSWTVTVKDNTSGAVLFTQTMGGPALAPRTGTFRTTNSSSYTITVGPFNRVIYSDCPSSLGEQVYADTWVFVGEDGSDNDFNDIYFSLTWFSRQG